MRNRSLIYTCHMLAWVVSALGSTVLIADNSMSRMIELTTKDPYCNVHTDRGNIRTMLLAADASRIRQMADEEIGKLEEVCQNKEAMRRQQGGFIYPGTKWCGPGDVAANYSDLGYFKKEDACCREHDNCPQYLMKGQCQQGICNNSPYTRSHCDCDATFRKCLQNVNSETANTIGAIFFNVIQVVCFQQRSPCSEWQSNSSSLQRNSMRSLINTGSSDCRLEWAKSDRYKPPGASRLRLGFFKRTKLLILKQNGYTQAEADEICSRWTFRPSDKYYPLMPITSN
ncbi:hypothetical protein HUJ04_001224 [Dendroctonus ponderosae]|nr:hypothetical protein HUJ04_001224 [Dendroctonus ponderosae]